jgi:hypothetical protein
MYYIDNINIEYNISISYKGSINKPYNNLYNIDSYNIDLYNINYINIDPLNISHSYYNTNPIGLAGRLNLYISNLGSLIDL